MEDRADLQVDALEAAEGPLHRTEALVGAHGRVGIERGLGHAGAHHVQSVQSGLGSNRRGVAPVGEEPLLVDGPREVLGHLVPGDDLAHPRLNLALAREAPLLAPGRRGNGCEHRLGGVEQGRALPRPLLGQQRIAAHHQTLAGVGIARDLHQVALVEQRQLHRRGLHQRADGRPAQRADPIEPGRRDLFADSRLGQHPTVTDQHHPRESEALAQLRDLRPHRARVGGVAGKHLHRHRTAVARAQQPELDLQLASLAVARVTALGQRADPSFHPHRGEVVEHQGALLHGNTLLPSKRHFLL